MRAIYHCDPLTLYAAEETPLQLKQLESQEAAAEDSTEGLDGPEAGPSELPVPENMLSHHWCRDLLLEHVVALASQQLCAYISLTTTAGLCHLIDAPYSSCSPLGEASTISPLHLKAPERVVEKLKKTVWLKVVSWEPNRMHRPQVGVKEALPRYGLAVEMHYLVAFDKDSKDVLVNSEATQFEGQSILSPLLFSPASLPLESLLNLNIWHVRRGAVVAVLNSRYFPWEQLAASEQKELSALLLELSNTSV